MSKRSVLYAAAVGLLCAGVLIAVLICTRQDRQAPRGERKQPAPSDATVDRKAAPDPIAWQPAVKPGPYPLLKDVDQVVLTAGSKLRSTAGPKLEALIRSLVKDRPSTGKLAPLKVDYPLDESIFPPEIVPPTFLWHESAPEADTWLIDVALAEGAAHVYVLSPGRPPAADDIDPECIGENNAVYRPTPYQASARSWRPGAEVWAAMKEGAAQGAAVVTISGFSSSRPGQVFSSGRTTFKTSRDPVGAPIFYRDVPLMPSEGEKGVIKPLAKKAISLVAWRLRDISRKQSRVLLKEMPTCANCHSFSRDGKTLGIDVDGPEGDKGAYAIVPVEKQTSIAPENVITWNSFTGKPAGHKTIGFMSQVSPDGRYAVTTVNEEIYVANFLDHKFLQVFYPTRGILAYYSRATDEIKALPGADDPDYVHCDPVWSPDGRYIVFARARAKDPYYEGQQLPSRAGDPAELPIRYDLYRVPFRGGRGGRCEPIAGASNNSMSNTFPKVSPDGKWIVFVKCRNGQLMRPDGKLCIVPASGGKARLMRCNTWRMNSWHSFSPNGRWLVFSSKANTPYTQMLLTHIDQDGNDSPAILVPNATPANRAVNIPEFVNIAYDGLAGITAPAVEPFRHFSRGRTLAESGRHREAVAEFQEALLGEPDDWRINAKLAESLMQIGQAAPAQAYFREALARRPNRPMLHNKMALALVHTKDFSQAMKHFDAVIKLDPQLAIAWCNRGSLRKQTGDPAGAMTDYDAAIRLDPTLAPAWFNRAFLRMQQEDWSGAQGDFQKCLELIPPNSPRRVRVERELRNLRSKLNPRR